METEEYEEEAAVLVVYIGNLKPCTNPRSFSSYSYYGCNDAVSSRSSRSACSMSFLPTTGFVI